MNDADHHEEMAKLMKPSRSIPDLILGKKVVESIKAESQNGLYCHYISCCFTSVNSRPCFLKKPRRNFHLRVGKIAVRANVLVDGTFDVSVKRRATHPPNVYRTTHLDPGSRYLIGFLNVRLPLTLN